MEILYFLPTYIYRQVTDEPMIIFWYIVTYSYYYSRILNS